MVKEKKRKERKGRKKERKERKNEILPDASTSRIDVKKISNDTLVFCVTLLSTMPAVELRFTCTGRASVLRSVLFFAVKFSFLGQILDQIVKF
jgi:hypothetical protein